MACYLEEHHFWDDVDCLFRNLKKVFKADDRIHWVRELEEKLYMVYNKLTMHGDWRFQPGYAQLSEVRSRAELLTAWEEIDSWSGPRWDSTNGSRFLKKRMLPVADELYILSYNSQLGADAAQVYRKYAWTIYRMFHGRYWTLLAQHQAGTSSLLL